MEASAFIAFIAGYGISVGTDKVSAVFPYISDTGTTPPASCVFGLFLNMSAAFGVVTIYIRHRHLEGNNLDHRIHKLNDVTMFMGLLSCLGLMMVACFQWSVAGVPHLLGAVMVFLLGGIYCSCQSYLTHACIGITTGKALMMTRVVLSLVAVVGLVLTVLFTALANNELTAAGFNMTTFGEKLHWTSKEPGYKKHLTSVFSEWIMGFAFLVFFATYYGDFKKLDTKVHLKCKSSIL